MRSVITLAVGLALVAGLLLIFGATAALAAAPSPLEQDVPAAPAAADVLDVSVSAHTAFTRTRIWTIAKSAADPNLPLFAGESGLISYTVQATKSTSQTGYHIQGTVLITNPLTGTATINAVSVALAGPTLPEPNPPAECGVTFPYDLPANDTLGCTFRANLPGPGSFPTTTVTVATEGNPPDSAVIVPSGPDVTSLGFTSVSINDSLAGRTLGKLSNTGKLFFTYPHTCPATPASYTNGLNQATFTNTATISETGDYADAAVTVNCFAPVVAQQVDGSLTTTWDWSIAKSADKASATVDVSGTVPVTYTVAVTNSSSQGYKVSGVISVTNGHPTQPMPVFVDAAVSGLTGVSLACENELNVPAGGTAACAFTADAPDNSPRTSVATASFAGGDYSTAPAPVIFSGTNEVDACVDVLDDNGTPGGSDTNLGTVCGAQAPKTFTYTAAPLFPTCGAQQFVNTARLVGSDTPALGSAAWTLAVNVLCGADNVKVLLPLIFEQAD